MKRIKIFGIMFFICAIFTVKAQKSVDKRLKSITPPNCKKINDEFFMDQTEISNLQWLEFLADLKEKDPESYLKNLPDTTVWIADELSEVTYLTNYFSYPGFRLFPVVGVSYEQVLKFCAWRSKKVTEDFNREKKKKFKKYQVIFTFELPTEAQWEEAAQGNTDDPYGFVSLTPKQLKRYPSGFYANYKDEKKLLGKGQQEWSALLLEYVYAFPSNSKGLHNMIGNVAEMVSEKGTSKGGSWTDTLEACAIKKQKKYTVPTAWLGFRCVCKVNITGLE